MDFPTRDEHKVILIVDGDSLLAAGLAHLLEQEAGTRTVVAARSAGWREAVVHHRPDVVIIPSTGLRLGDEELDFLFSMQQVPRVILVSPDCNAARVYDLSCSWLNQIHDLLSLIHEDQAAIKDSASGG